MAVDPHGAGLDGRGQPRGGGEVLGPDAGRQPVAGVVGDRRHVLHGLDGCRNHHRTENLFLNDGHFRAGFGDHRGRHKGAQLARLFAAGDYFGTAVHAAVDVAHDLVGLPAVDQGADLHVLIQSVTQLHPGRDVRNACHHLVINFLVHVEPGSGDADLAGIEEDGIGRAGDGEIQIRVVHDDGGRLAAQLQSHLF